MIVSSGQSSSGIVVSNEELYVSSGAYVDDIKVSDGGEMHVYSGASACNASAYANGQIFADSGAFIHDIRVSKGGEIHIESEANADFCHASKHC